MPTDVGISFEDTASDSPATVGFVVVGATESMLSRSGQGSLARHSVTLISLLLSAFVFGCYHFTYPSPWNSWDTARTLTIVWVFVTLFFATTRSLPAAIVFNNMMAIIGFVLRDLSLPVGMALGSTLAIVSASAAVAVATVASSETWKFGRRGQPFR